MYVTFTYVDRADALIARIPRYGKVSTFGAPGSCVDGVQGVILACLTGLFLEPTTVEALGIVFVCPGEAPSFAMPVITYDNASKGASAYRALAKELLGISKPAPAAA